MAFEVIFMVGSYYHIAKYLQNLQTRYGVQICIKDFCGFIPINKELDEAIRPFLAHTNPYCMYMKSDQEHWWLCLSMIRRMYNKLERTRATYFGVCHGGLGEYVVPIYNGDTLLGSVNAGFFPVSAAKVHRRICRSCAQEPKLDAAEAEHLYQTCIHTPTISPEDLLPGLELVAEYLGQTYQILQRTHAVPTNAVRYHTSSEDTILTHALEYIRRNAASHIAVSELADFCHCSESYLSRIFKRRTGVNINVYINKVRVEQAKNNLLLSHDSIAEIASSVGFSDPNYFTRVFTQIIGISPTEFRRRFQA